LDVTFGQFIGDPADAVEICVRIKKRVAYLAKERQFSPLESKKTLPTGDLEIRFPASSSGP
jgi:hypothetical protein